MLSEGERHVQAMRLVCEALADREKHGEDVQWDVINQQLDHMDAILQGIADQRSDDAEEIQILKKERHAACERISTVRDEVAAEIETLRQQLSADGVRQELEELKAKNAELVEKIRAAAGHVDLIEDSNRNLQAEVETLKTQLDDARVATLNARALLDAARAETVEVRRRLNEETDRHRATNAEKIIMFEHKESANQHAAELVKERDAALAAVSLQRSGIERLNAFVGKVRAVVDNDCDGLEIDEMIKALGELDAETEPAPCPECERLREELERANEHRIDLVLFADSVRGAFRVWGGDESFFHSVSHALDKLDANSSPTLTSSVVTESLTPEPEDGQ